MMRYALLGVVIVGGVVALAALDISKWSAPEEPPLPLPKVAPAQPPLPPPSSLLPPITQIPTITPPPLPETITPPATPPPMPAPIPIPAPEPAPPRKPVARPKAPAAAPPAGPSLPTLLPPQAIPVEPRTTARNDLLLARKTIKMGQLTDARELLARIQTRLVFRPVTPDQPDRFDRNSAATVVGRAIRALDDGDRDAAVQIIDNVLAETPE